MSEWKSAKAAPKDRTILVYGQPRDTDGLRFTGPAIYTAYWDSIDSAYCLSGATWLGPFIEPEFWMELPPPPSPYTRIRRREK